MEVVYRITWAQIQAFAARKPKSIVTWAMHTCWWNVPDITNVWHTLIEGTALPTCPRGSVLMQGEIGKFVAKAEEHPTHYGRHGLQALAAAFEGNLTGGILNQSASLESWDHYNDVIDKGTEKPDVKNN